MILPPKGLIVSCYLHSRKGTEQQLIEELWYDENVKSLRIEGLDNLYLAKKLKDIKDKYVIGLIKDHVALSEDRPYITHNTEDIKRVCDSGADMVAIEVRANRFRETTKDIEGLFSVATLPIMADVEYAVDGDTAYCAGADIISTTFCDDSLDMGRFFRDRCGFRVNVEGGLTRPLDIIQATGFDWYTIGRAIHDTRTIIKTIVNLGFCCS